MVSTNVFDVGEMGVLSFSPAAASALTLAAAGALRRLVRLPLSFYPGMSRRQAGLPPAAAGALASADVSLHNETRLEDNDPLGWDRNLITGSRVAPGSALPLFHLENSEVPKFHRLSINKRSDNGIFKCFLHL
jgi:hypothetical protein